MQSIPRSKVSFERYLSKVRRYNQRMPLFGICTQSASPGRYPLIKLLSIHRAFVQKTVEFVSDVYFIGMHCTGQNCWQAEHDQWSARDKKLTGKSCKSCWQWIKTFLIETQVWPQRFIVTNRHDLTALNDKLHKKQRANNIPVHFIV